jgi:hypothetical protein
MRSSDDYRPVAKSVEVLGDHFNELERRVPGLRLHGPPSLVRALPRCFRIRP